MKQERDFNTLPLVEQQAIVFISYCIGQWHMTEHPNVQAKITEEGKIAKYGAHVIHTAAETPITSNARFWLIKALDKLAKMGRDGKIALTPEMFAEIKGMREELRTAEAVRS